MKKWQKGSAVAGVAALAVGLSACGKSSKGAASKGNDSTPTLLMYRVEDKPDNYDQLIDNANEVIEREIGAKLKTEFVGWGDWDQKALTTVASDESYDISLAQNYATDAQEGTYVDLTDLAPKYTEEAYDQLPDNYIKGNMINGKLHAFPILGNSYGQQILTFNKEYVDKYNLNISRVDGSYESVTEVLKELHKEEPNIATFIIGQTLFATGNYGSPIGNQYSLVVKTIDTGSSKTINQYADKDMINNLKVLHQRYKDGLTPTDAATDTTPYDLNTSTWLMRQEIQRPVDYGDTILTQAAGKPLVSHLPTEPLETTAQAQMVNYVVANTSKNKEKAVELLGLLNSNPELLNGLVHGEESKQHEKTGDDRVKLLKDYTPTIYLGVWNTGNNLIIWSEESVTKGMVKERDKSIEEVKDSLTLGFTFVDDRVKTEITNVATVMNRHAVSLNTGTVDPEETLPKLMDDLKTVDWDKVQKEM